ncbi:hypothetical protein HDU83_001794 [Entophlyctis luteolus]|nr:hypothetical protein HDU83_001794 [Entophlyctis luteolus]
MGLAEKSVPHSTQRRLDPGTNGRGHVRTGAAILKIKPFMGITGICLKLHLRANAGGRNLRQRKAFEMDDADEAASHVPPDAVANTRRQRRAALNRKHQRDFWRRKTERLAALEARLHSLQHSPAVLRHRLRELQTVIARMARDRDALRARLAAVESFPPSCASTESCSNSPTAAIPRLQTPNVPIHSLKAVFDGSLFAKFNALRRDLCFVCTLSPELNAYIERLCQLSIEPIVCTDVGALVMRLDEFMRFKHLLLEHCAPQMRQQVLEIVDSAQVESEYVFAIDIPELPIDIRDINPGDKEHFMNSCKQVLNYDDRAVKLVNELHVVNKRLKVKHRILNMCNLEQRKIILWLIEECRSQTSA